MASIKRILLAKPVLSQTELFRAKYPHNWGDDDCDYDTKEVLFYEGFGTSHVKIRKIFIKREKKSRAIPDTRTSSSCFFFLRWRKEKDEQVYHTRCAYSSEAVDKIIICKLSSLI